MTEQYNEPTWGAEYGGGLDGPRQPAQHAGPIQQPYPVVGPPGNVGGQPFAHADYHRQAAEYFETGVSPECTGSVPNFPAPTAGYGAQGSPYPSYVPAARGDNPVIRLMERGLRGELLQQAWFQRFRHQSPDPFVLISYGAGVFVTILVMLTPSAILSTLVVDALWLAIGYLYLAVGTRLAHQFLEFGICVAGTVVLAAQIWAFLVAIDTTAQYLPAYVEPRGVLVVKLILDIAAAALLVYVGAQVHRGIARLTAR